MRRDKLFHLARKVVRDSGYQYSKGHSRLKFHNFSHQAFFYSYHLFQISIPS